MLIALRLAAFYRREAAKQSRYENQRRHSEGASQLSRASWMSALVPLCVLFSLSACVSRRSANSDWSIYRGRGFRFEYPTTAVVQVTGNAIHISPQGQAPRNVTLRLLLRDEAAKLFESEAMSGGEASVITSGSAEMRQLVYYPVGRRSERTKLALITKDDRAYLFMCSYEESSLIETCDAALRSFKLDSKQGD